MSEAYPDLLETPSRHDPFRTLVGCILSQRTRDSNSERAAETLFSRASTPGDILGLRREELHDLIRCSGFYRQKADHITGTCRALMERNDGDVPRDRETLLTLPGVGPKTADIVLTHCFGEAAIPVDVHVSRVSKRLGLAPMDASPEETQSSLHTLIPRDKYLFYDRSIVRLGKEYCRKTNPLCGECPLRDCCDYQKSLTQGYDALS
ncbi:MAG TPA: endonuclease III [Candidatus Krumholzibacteriaceae bacterium]|nr:endonuclease III [Candidatus Krumholzibacteriaceae bacterium]